MFRFLSVGERTGLWVVRLNRPSRQKVCVGCSLHLHEAPRIPGPSALRQKALGFRTVKGDVVQKVVSKLLLFNLFNLRQQKLQPKCDGKRL